jgi:hypothetical protein
MFIIDLDYMPYNMKERGTDCVSTMEKQIIMEHSYPTFAPIHCDYQNSFKIECYG